MIEDAISARGKSKLVVAIGTFDAVQYTNIVRDEYFPMKADYYGGEKIGCVINRVMLFA